MEQAAAADAEVIIKATRKENKKNLRLNLLARNVVLRTIRPARREEGIRKDKTAQIATTRAQHMSIQSKRAKDDGRRQPLMHKRDKAKADKELTALQSQEQALLRILSTCNTAVAEAAVAKVNARIPHASRYYLVMHPCVRSRLLPPLLLPESQQSTPWLKNVRP